MRVVLSLLLITNAFIAGADSDFPGLNQEELLNSKPPNITVSEYYNDYYMNFFFDNFAVIYDNYSRELIPPDVCYYAFDPNTIFKPKPIKDKQNPSQYDSNIDFGDWILYYNGKWCRIIITDTIDEFFLKSSYKKNLIF